MINYKNATCWENVWGKLMFTLSGIWFSKITLFWTSEFPFESFKIDSLYRKWKERGDSIFLSYLFAKTTRHSCPMHPSHSNVQVKCSFQGSYEIHKPHRIDPRIHCGAWKKQRDTSNPRTVIKSATAAVVCTNLQNTDSTHRRRQKNSH